ncbi:MAG: histidine kinase [Thermoflavifilum sp.]|nr:histidine kinase [Thermoflavifilum sp.]
MSKTIKWLPNRKTRVILLHALVWLAYGVVLMNWLTFGYFYLAAIPLILRTLFIQAAIFYLNTELLLPRLMERNHFIAYIISVIALVVGASVLYEITNDLSVIRNAFMVLRPPHKPRFPHGHRPILGPWFVINMFSSLAILFVSTTYWAIVQARKRLQWEFSMKNENLQTELKFLKSQINPHFLFNALNNIYSLSYTRSEKTPEMIMKLSNMLRYMLYENNERKVSLQEEINYIRHYIDFQLLKIEGQPKLEIDMDEVDYSLQIEPMLFIPFIENAFKHSNVEDTRKGWIRMQLRTANKTVYFHISNSIPDRAYTKDEAGGIGLQNIRKRLELLYPNKHQLHIDTHDGVFTVDLQIDTQ